MAPMQTTMKGKRPDKPNELDLALLTGKNAPLEPVGKTVDTDALVVSVMNLCQMFRQEHCNIDHTYTVAEPLIVVGIVIVETKVTVVGDGDNVIVVTLGSEWFEMVVTPPEPVEGEPDDGAGNMGYVAEDPGASHGC